MNQDIRPHIPFTPANTAIVRVDHPPCVPTMDASLRADTVTRNAGVLARWGEALDIPLVISSTRQTLEFVGTKLVSVSGVKPA